MEVDQQQINLDRFSLFFPEKRPFFLENAGAFTVSNSGGAAFNDPAQTKLFFSRRIGISSSGRAIPILGGARLSGKVSDTVTVGFLNMQTDAVDGSGANNVGVARLRRDLPKPVEHRCPVRQSAGDRAWGRRHRLQQNVWHRRTVGLWPERAGIGVRRADRDAGTAG